MNIIPYPFKKPRIDDDKLIAAYKKYKSLNATAIKLKLDRSSIRTRLVKIGIYQANKTFTRTKEINKTQSSQPFNENRKPKIIHSKIQPKTYKDYLLEAIKDKKLPEYYASFKILKK